MNYIAIIFVGFYSVLNMCSHCHANTYHTSQQPGAEWEKGVNKIELKMKCHLKSLKIELYPIFRSVFCLKLAKMFSKFM